MATSREKKWRDKIKDKLIKANMWKQFNQQQLEYRRQNGCTTHKAYVETAISMNLDPQWKDYLAADNERRRRIAESRAKRAVVKDDDVQDNRESIMEMLDTPDEEEAEKIREEEIRRERELVLNTIPNVVVQDDGKFDPIRDAEWVYRNMNRLFKVDKVLGIERLDEDVLTEAPSNAAVGLAAHALRDKSKFYEKYGLILLKQSEKEDADAQTEDQLIEELDPSFRGLERYLAEKVPTNDAEILDSDLGKTSTGEEE